MSNFESGPVNLNNDGKALRWEDAAKTVTISGWACVKCDRFYGDNERAARYCCHTDAPCENAGKSGCAGRKLRHRVLCDACGHAADLKRYAETLEVEDLRAPCALCPLAVGDTYFFDEESLFEFCDDQKLNPSDLMLHMCRPHNPGEFSITEYVSDYLVEDAVIENSPGTPEELRAVDNAVNEYIFRHSPFSWYPDSKKRPSKSVLDGLDRRYEEGKAP